MYQIYRPVGTEIQGRSECPNLRPLLSGFQKLLNINAGFAEDRSEGSFCHVARVMRDGHFATGGRVTPDLVAARPLAVEDKSQFPEAASDLSVLETGKAPH